VGYFQTWNSEFILQNSYHTDAELKEYFNHEVVMNMDELPSFNVKSYEYANGGNSSSSSSGSGSDSGKTNNKKDDQCFSIILGYSC